MKPNYANFRTEDLCNIIRLLSPTMDDYLYLYDVQDDYYFISPHAVDRFCLPDYCFHNVRKIFDIFVHPEDIQSLKAEITDLLSPGSARSSHNQLYRWLSVEGDPIWINCRGAVVRDDSGHPLYMIGCINEVGNSQKADNISGLLRDSSFRNYLLELTSILPDGYVLRLGIDDLKSINARLGVEYGDQILRKTSEILSASIRPGQKLYRIMGDEFIIVDFIGCSEEDPFKQYKEIQRALAGYVAEIHYEMVITISAGLVKCKDLKHFTYSNIMRLTEFALDEAKQRGKNQCYAYSSEDYAAFLKRKKLLLYLRQSVNEDFKGFEVHFQPIFSKDGGTLIGAEALMRFQCEEYGRIPPCDFIPLLEDSGLIIPAGLWILNKALDACRSCRKYISDFKISVNLSHVQIMKSDISREIISSIRDHQLDNSQMIVELTESGLLEQSQRFSSMWTRLKASRVNLALDDFGTGYSNFRYLTEMNPNIIKIDRTFTEKALQKDFEYGILSLLIQMAHKLELQVCIEGVETADEFSRIQELEPDYIQGYYTGRPCAFSNFMDNYVLCG